VNIAFRVDASPEIGLGHLMRCGALSEALTQRGNSCMFLSKITNKKLLNSIKKTNATHQNIPPDVSLKKDLEIVIKLSHETEIDWVITDHYAIDTHYLKTIKKNGFKVLSIDDTAQIHYPSDLVVNQNAGAKQLRFSAETYTKFLLGPEYAILRDNLLMREQKKENTGVKKLLITIGGTDPDNFTLRILRELESIDPNIEITTVLGPYNRFYNTIRRYADKSDQNIVLRSSPKNMVDMYLASDIAISAGGSSCYELAYFGIPHLIIAVAENQLNIARELGKQKISIFLGEKNDIKKGFVKDKVKDLIDDPLLRRHMSQNGRKLVDGNGKQRIVHVMEKIH